MKSETVPCGRCERRGKNWTGDDPRCAFSESGDFLNENWNCATMNALRECARVREAVVWSEDQNAAVLPWEGIFIALSWYKSRGKTDLAVVFDGPDARRLTLDEAEEYLGELQ